jgi:MinD-like ATPase involved in chromosome partitioning or flagellar assembly
MLIACWSVKGGSGTTVVSVALASRFARDEGGGAVLADFAGDVPAVLGIPEPSGPGLAEWLAAGDAVPADGLRRLEVEGGPGLVVLPAGEPGGAGSPVSRRGEVLGALLAADHRPVVADCGSEPSGARLAVAASATVSLLVLRPCYLSLRRALKAPVRPSGVVLVSEPGRSLGRHDVEAVLGVPVRAVVPVEPAVARSVDAGLLGARLPRGLARTLRHAV